MGPVTKPLSPAVGTGRAAAPIVAACALLVAAVAAAAFVPDMRWWGIDALRFAAPLAWAWLAVAAFALVPGVAARVEVAAGRLGDALVTRPLAVAAAAVCVGLVAWLLPDRGFVVGDALLRHGTLESPVRSALVYPQALPLELLLHVRLPLFLADAGVCDAITAARLFGALEAALIGGLAALFARALGLRGAAAAIAWSMVAWGGWLGLCTGYAKALSDLVVVVLATAVCAVHLVRTGRGALALGAAVAVGLLLHRSALALGPAFALALALSWFDGGRRSGSRVAVRNLLVGLAPVALAAVLVGPATWSTMSGIDRAAHFASEDVAQAGGLLAATFAHRRLLDLANALLFLSPAFVVGTVALVAGGRTGFARPETWVLATLALAHAGMSALVHPAQGVFRDWDIFAPSAMAAATLAAWATARAIGARPRSLVAAMAVSGAILLPPAFALPWLTLAADSPRSLARVEAFLREPPERTAVERAKTWDFLGAAYYRARRPLDAARAFAMAAETSANPRLFLQQAQAAREGGDLVQAERAYRRAAGLAGDPTAAWQALGALAWARGDLAGALEAARALLALAPDDPARRRGLRAVEQAIALRRAVTDSLRAPSPSPPAR